MGQALELDLRLKRLTKFLKHWLYVYESPVNVLVTEGR